MALQRAKEISPIMICLSKYKLEDTYIEFGEMVYRPNFKNIKTNEDLAREEFRGAILRYLLGIDDDAIIHACSALEAGLLVKIEEKIKSGELKEKDIHHPFTLGRNVNLWLPKSAENKYGKGLITDEKIIKKLNRVKTTRDCHFHGFNFIASLMMFYKNQLKQSLGIIPLDLVKEHLEKDMDAEDLKKIEKILGLPSGIVKQLISDFNTGIKTIENLSDFNRFAEEKPLKLAKKRIEKYGFDLFHSIAKETLYDTCAILKHIGIL
jgi:hypothetical protein